MGFDPLGRALAQLQLAEKERRAVEQIRRDHMDEVRVTHQRLHEQLMKKLKSALSDAQFKQLWKEIPWGEK